MNNPFAQLHTIVKILESQKIITEYTADEISGIINDAERDCVYYEEKIDDKTFKVRKDWKYYELKEIGKVTE